MSFLIRSVNWRDGMWLRQEHFDGERAGMMERLRWVARHATTEHGLVPRRPTGSSDSEWHEGARDAPLAYAADVTDAGLRVTVSRCLALTPGGGLVHVDSETPAEAGGTPPLEKTFPLLALDGKTVGVFVKVAPGEPEVEFGPTTSDEPPRPAWRLPRYSLEAHTSSPNQPETLLQIARFVVRGGDAEEDLGFIPACMTVGSHSRLRERARELREHVRKLRQSAVRVCQEIQAKRLGPNSDASWRDLEDLARYLALTASRADSYLEEWGASASPRQMIVALGECLHCVIALLDTHPQIQEQKWAKHLDTAGATLGTRDAISFAHRSETALQGARQDDLGASLKTMTALFELMETFPGRLIEKHEDHEDEDDVHPGFLTYANRRYKQIEYEDVDFEMRGEFPTVRIRPKTAHASGEYLIWVRTNSAEQRDLARMLKRDSQSAYISMPATPNARFDVSSNKEAVIGLLPLPGGEPVASIYLSCPPGQQFDLKKLSEQASSDLRLYHREVADRRRG